MSIPVETPMPLGATEEIAILVPDSCSTLPIHPLPLLMPSPILRLPLLLGQRVTTRTFRLLQQTSRAALWPAKRFKAVLTTSGLSILRFIDGLWFLGKLDILCCFCRR